MAARGKENKIKKNNNNVHKHRGKSFFYRTILQLRQPRCAYSFTRSAYKIIHLLFDIHIFESTLEMSISFPRHGINVCACMTCRRKAATESKWDVSFDVLGEKDGFLKSRKITENVCDNENVKIADWVTVIYSYSTSTGSLQCAFIGPLECVWWTIQMFQKQRICRRHDAGLQNRVNCKQKAKDKHWNSAEPFRWISMRTVWLQYGKQNKKGP